MKKFQAILPSNLVAKFTQDFSDFPGKGTYEESRIIISTDSVATRKFIVGEVEVHANQMAMLATRGLEGWSLINPEERFSWIAIEAHPNAFPPAMGFEFRSCNTNSRVTFTPHNSWGNTPEESNFMVDFEGEESTYFESLQSLAKQETSYLKEEGESDWK